MESAEVARAFNNKVNALRYMLPGALDPDDCYILPLVAPSQILSTTEGRPFRTDSFLCKVCRRALEYLAFFLEVFSHHQNLFALQKYVLSFCHLYSLLALHLKGPPVANIQ